ncbi:arsenic metallochaperone ArsD family protein [Listeria sp. PSOL-1]|uniref:arsenic metallochaperone ArsD family protein n=1 Tax=Listeria sp. PSOL-1 TaxID=1844999 RepID=UPI0013D119B9|nr:arsenic metallochaperone ArsD family protein [Listeria sp. PSOL-1]
MINLKYFCLEEELQFELEIEVINQLASEEFKQAYLDLNGIKIEIQVFFLNESEVPFKAHENVYALIKQKGKDILPIVTLNDKIIKKNALLNNDEIEEIFGIGIDAQID